MIFLVSEIPKEEIKSKQQLIDNKIFLELKTNVKNKNFKKDYNLEVSNQWLWWASQYLNNHLYAYLMSNNYYYKSKLYEIFQNSFLFSNSYYVPRNVIDIDEHPGRYKIVTNRVFTEIDIENMFDAFAHNNFNKNPIMEKLL